LSDEGNEVAGRYDGHALAGGHRQPGQTFVLIDESETVTDVRDYGAPESGGIMYVVPDEFIRELRHQL
jgi:hypothetical protein